GAGARLRDPALGGGSTAARYLLRHPTSRLVAAGHDPSHPRGLACRCLPPRPPYPTPRRRGGAGARAPFARGRGRSTRAVRRPAERRRPRSTRGGGGAARGEPALSAGRAARRRRGRRVSSRRAGARARGGGGGTGWRERTGGAAPAHRVARPRPQDPKGGLAAARRRARPARTGRGIMTVWMVSVLLAARMLAAPQEGVA